MVKAGIGKVQRIEYQRRQQAGIRSQAEFLIMRDGEKARLRGDGKKREDGNKGQGYQGRRHQRPRKAKRRFWRAKTLAGKSVNGKTATSSAAAG